MQRGRARERDKHTHNARTRMYMNPETQTETLTTLATKHRYHQESINQEHTMTLIPVLLYTIPSRYCKPEVADAQLNYTTPEWLPPGLPLRTVLSAALLPMGYHAKVNLFSII